MRGLLHTQPTLESIDFQSGAFFKELTLAFTELKKVKKDDLQDPDHTGVLAAVVKQHTGMKIVFSIDEYEPCIEIPMVNKNNPLVNNYFRNYIDSSDGMRMIQNAGGVARGTVNLRTGKVDGIYGDLEAKIHLPKTMFSTSTYSPEEIAAVTLHECGHLLTYFEYMARTVTTNQALAGMSKALDGSAGVDEREAVLINVKKALKLGELDVQALAKSNNKKVAEVVVITHVAQQAASELGSNIYDFSTWEYLSDQYAARQGAGRYLATALDKIFRGGWNISFRSMPAYLAFEAFKIVSLFLVPAVGVLFMMMDGISDPSYDRPGARVQRIRNQIVENLKDKKLSKDDQERLAADLTVVDEMAKQINDRRQLLNVIWDTLSPSSRKARNQELLQKQLEDLAANDLFVKAAALKQLM